MKKIIFNVGILNLLLVFGLIFAGCGGNSDDPNNNQQGGTGGLTVNGNSQGLFISLDISKAPGGFDGIAYNIKGPNYKEAVIFWFSATQVSLFRDLQYTFTEANQEYSVQVQYTGPGTQGLFDPVKATARGGIGDFMLYETGTVSYLNSSNTIQVRPIPRVDVPPTIQDGYLGLQMHLGDWNSIGISKFYDLETTQVTVNELNNNYESWNSRPLSFYVDRDIYVEWAYYALGSQVACHN